MNRIASILTQTVVATTCFFAIAIGAPAVGEAQMVVEAPPPAFIASSTPEYYEGRPVYFFNNAWYYRDGDHWNYYRREPDFLRERRSHWAEGDREHGRYRYHR
jgi:hypothetical protein